MGIISGSSANKFKSSSYIYGNVKRFLNSFDAAGLIDEGEFDKLVRDILGQLGIGAYKESKAVMRVKDFKAQLPDDFSQLYVAYKCSLLNESVKKEAHQQQNVAFVIDVTDEIVESNNCEINCYENNNMILEKITIKTTVELEKDRNHSLTFGNVIPLRLSPNVNRDFCVNDCHNLHVSSQLEISINNGYIYTNFNDDFIYIKYYAIPIDEDGNIQIPDIESKSIEKAIETYLIYMILSTLWYNGQAPDLESRKIDAERNFNKAFAQARYEIKLPSFSEMVNTIRTKRSINQMKFHTEQFTNTGFQRIR